ncbi:hypothetical protein T492DRAFT_1111095 [Pavlovales sp. CCMP2436]|nr:hypothetical protein T492DRAFT_1111095 [Pavlovales sp. CCMP2436]
MRSLPPDALATLGAAALGNPALCALSLDVSGCALEPRAAAQLARALRLDPAPTFERLLLNGHRFGDVATRELLSALCSQPLRHLSLDGALTPAARPASGARVSSTSPFAAVAAAPGASCRMQAISAAYAGGSPVGRKPGGLPLLPAIGRPFSATPLPSASPHRRGEHSSPRFLAFGGADALPSPPGKAPVAAAAQARAHSAEALVDAVGEIIASADALASLSLGSAEVQAGPRRLSRGSSSFASPAPERLMSAPCGRSRVSPTQGERLSTWPRLLAAVSSSRSLQVLNLTGIPLREEQTDELKVAFEASGSLLVLECCHMRLFKSNWQTAFANGGGAGEPTP